MVTGKLILAKGGHLERGQYCLAQLTEDPETAGQVNPETIEPKYFGFWGILGDQWITSGIMRSLARTQAITMISFNQQDYEEFYDDDDD